MKHLLVLQSLLDAIMTLLGFSQKWINGLVDKLWFVNNIYIHVTIISQKNIKWLHSETHNKTLLFEENEQSIGLYDIASVCLISYIYPKIIISLFPNKSAIEIFLYYPLWNTSFSVLYRARQVTKYRIHPKVNGSYFKWTWYHHTRKLLC